MFTPDGFAYSYVQLGGMVIQHQRSDGQLDWARSWTGDFTIYAMAKRRRRRCRVHRPVLRRHRLPAGCRRRSPERRGREQHLRHAPRSRRDHRVRRERRRVLRPRRRDERQRGRGLRRARCRAAGSAPVPLRSHRPHASATSRMPGMGDFGLADRTWLAASGRAYWSRSSEFPRYQQWPYYAALLAL